MALCYQNRPLGLLMSKPPKNVNTTSKVSNVKNNGNSEEGAHSGLFLLSFSSLFFLCWNDIFFFCRQHTIMIFGEPSSPAPSEPTAATLPKGSTVFAREHHCQIRFAMPTTAPMASITHSGKVQATAPVAESTKPYEYHTLKRRTLTMSEMEQQQHHHGLALSGAGIRGVGAFANSGGPAFRPAIPSFVNNRNVITDANTIHQYQQTNHAARDQKQLSLARADKTGEFLLSTGLAGTSVCSQHRALWVTPHPDQLPKSFGRESLSSWPAPLLRLMLSFVDSVVLDTTCVFVSRLWNVAIKEDVELRARRVSFVWGGVKDYDGKGILHYLAYLMHAGGGLPNASLGPTPFIKPCASGILSTRPFPTTNITSLGVSQFVTENLPFSWVGIDFQTFRVDVTAYTFGTTVEAKTVPQAVPLEWELQGSVDGGDDWGTCRWIVLDKRKSEIFVNHREKVMKNTKSKKVARPTAKGESDHEEDQQQRAEDDQDVDVEYAQVQGRLSATFVLPRSVNASDFSPNLHFRKLRIVQTGRNAHWGHELVVSGLEFYGRLFKSQKRM